MTSQNLINEVFWLRCIACLAVTLGHAIHNGYFFYPNLTIYHSGAYILNMAVLFGVPVFIFISEFLLANKYINKVPAGFIKKRIKILFFPFLFMNAIYAFINLQTWSFSGFFVKLAGAIFLGKSAVYFILIIFQFYFLHMYLSKYLNRLSPKIIIPLSFIINILYLAVFNFLESPNNALAHYIWSTGYWLPFVGWIFYFVLGFYCGKNYQTVINILRKKGLILLPFIGLMIMLIMNKYFLINQDSKRLDMLLYASSVIFFIMYISTFIKRVPGFVVIISNYSFSIFLLNVFFLELLKYIEPPSFFNILTYSFTVFLLTLTLCMSTAYLLNKFRVGKYLVGRVMQFKVNQRGVEKRSSHQHRIMAIKNSK